MRVNYKLFKSSFKTWETLYDEACEYASRLGPDLLVNISHSCDAGTATVTVWFWGKY